LAEQLGDKFKYQKQGEGEGEQFSPLSKYILVSKITPGGNPAS